MFAKRKSKPMLSLTSREIGDLGEERVVRYLKKKRYRIVARNYTVRGGEIDIIAESSAYIVFVEVKTRSSATDPEKYGRAWEAVDEEKIRRIRSTARQYLREHPTAKKPRCDVAEVYLDPPLTPRSKAHIMYHEEEF